MNKRRLGFLFLMSIIVLSISAFAYSNSFLKIPRKAIAAPTLTVYYAYRGPQPITALYQIRDQSNWEQVFSYSECPRYGYNLCSISFDNSALTLAQTLSAIPLGPYTDGQIVLVGFKPITIYTRL